MRCTAGVRIARSIAASIALFAALLGPVLLPLHVCAAHVHRIAARGSVDPIPRFIDASAQPGDDDDADCPICQVLHAAQHAIESHAPRMAAPNLACVGAPALVVARELSRFPLLPPSRAPPVTA